MLYGKGPGEVTKDLLKGKSEQEEERREGALRPFLEEDFPPSILNTGKGKSYKKRVRNFYKKGDVGNLDMLASNS